MLRGNLDTLNLTASCLIVLVTLSGCTRRAGQTIDLDDLPVGSKNTVNPVTPSGQGASSLSAPRSPAPLKQVEGPHSAGGQYGQLQIAPERGGKAVAINTHDGVRLVGTWFKPTNAAMPVLILLHELGRSRKDWSPLANRFHEGGYGVLTIDLRGHGISVVKFGRLISWKQFSGRDFNDMTFDVQAAVEFVRGESARSPRIVLIGAGLGASVALQFASRDSQIGAVALISPGVDNFGATVIEAMKRYQKRPLLMMASSGDATTAAAVKQLADLARGRAKVITEPGNSRGIEMLMMHPDLVSRITAFLEETLSHTDQAASVTERKMMTGGVKVKGL